MTIEIGQRLGGRYEVRAIAGGAGRSGMGTVYLCHDLEQQTAIALKTYQERYCRDRALYTHFTRGARAWIRLDRHPCVVRAYGVFDIAERLFLGLEYIAPDDEGRNTLSRHLESAIPLDRVLRWAIQFCDGIEHARRQGVTPHRDIKPDNLMITRDGDLKVTDFDLSGPWEEGEPLAENAAADQDHVRSVIEVVRGRRVVGTPPWMAPEQFAGETSVQSDLYSFGIVLYQLCAHGRLPYRPTENESWAATHLSARAKALDSPLWPLIARCLSKSPADRFGGAQADNGFLELRQALAALWRLELPDRPLPAPPTGADLDAEDHSSRGASLAALGLHDEALAEFDKAIAMKPDFAPAYLNAGVSHAKSGNPSRAGEAYRKAIALDPELAEAHNNWGLLCAGEGRGGEAEQAYRRAIALQPGLNGAYRNLGVLLSEAGRHDEAIALMQQAVAGDPLNAGHQYSLGVSLEKAGRHAEALPAFQEAVRLKPDSGEYLYGLGNGWRFNGDMNQAVDCWQRAGALDPGNASIWFNLGIAHEHAQQTARAWAYHQRAIRAQPSKPGSYYNLGLMLAQHGLYAEAADHFDKFLEHLTPDLQAHAAKAHELRDRLRDDARQNEADLQHPEAVYNRGNGYLKLGRLDEARAWFERALNMRPDYAAAHTAMGVAHEHGGDWEQARDCHQRAVEADPSLALAWNNLGWTEYNTGRNEAARRAYRRYVEIAPAEQAAWVEDARSILARLGEPEQAEDPPARPPAAETGAAPSPIDQVLDAFNQGRADDGLAQLASMAEQAGSAEMHNTLGEELASRGKYDEALEQYFKALDLDAEDRTIYFNIGRAFLAKKDYPAAEGQFQDLCEMYPDDPAFPHQLGETYRLMDAPAKAIPAYQKALQLRDDLSPVHCNLGTCYDALGKPKEAASAYMKAIKIKPDNDTAHFNLAQNMERQGFADLAIKSYRDFLACARPGRESVVAHAKQAIARLGG